MPPHHIKAVTAWHVRALLTGANLLGVGVLLAEFLYLIPLGEAGKDPEVRHDNVVLSLVLTAFATFVILWGGRKRLRHALSWTCENRDPTPDEALAVIRLPMLAFRTQLALWLFSTSVFFISNLSVDLAFAALSGSVVLAGGVATVTTAYLLVSRLLRPTMATVLALHPPDVGTQPGVGSQAFMTWSLTTGVPVLSLVIVGAFATYTQPTFIRMAVVSLIGGGVVLFVGLFAAILFAKSVGDPLEDLSHALALVEAGNLDVRVTVDDGGEIGQLQAGLNRMVDAMQERAQLRDLFGRHVGEDVARQALAHGVQLGGEELEAGALFVDVIGSTTFTATHTPAEVVDALNRFFEVVIDVVHRHGGLVNKFEGDAALCIFGAPLPTPQASSQALSAAREMAVRLRMEVPELEAGIGVSWGHVIAGNIGSASRLEYTVIGDPVNEAARLTEQAKTVPERVVASERIVARSGDEGQDHWRLIEPRLLRGRLEPTVLAVPV